MTLRITVEVLPGGDPARVEKIGHLYLANEGPPLTDPEAADLRAYTVGDCITGRYWTVEHRRSEGAWALVAAAIAARPPG